MLGSFLFLLVATGLVFAAPEMPVPVKTTLIVFAGAIAAWSFSKIDPTFVAVAAALAMSVLAPQSGQMPLAGLGDPFILLVIAGFMLGGAYKSSGLSERIAGWFVARAVTVTQLFYQLTTALILLSFVTPSTSARAAVMMPVYAAVAGATPHAGVRKALAVLFPVVIVLSCVTSYLGAAANLMTADFIEKFTGTQISYLEWLKLGVPFGIVSCFGSVWILLRLFLNPMERKMKFELQVAPQKNDSNSALARKKVLAVTALMMFFWVTETWHGLDAAVVALAGAALLAAPDLGVVSFKQAVKEVEWPLILFMAATIDLGQALIQSGSVDYISTAVLNRYNQQTGWILTALLLLTALLSHLFIHSRTARAAVLMPVLIPLGMSAGQSGMLVAFFCNAAMGYCLTLPICAKPVAMFSNAGEDGYTAADLLRLSVWLIPFHLLLLAVAMWGYS